MDFKKEVLERMIKECIQPLLDLKKGFEKQENKVDEITDSLPSEKYPSVNAVINYVKNKITAFSDSLVSVYTKITEFEKLKNELKGYIHSSEKGVKGGVATLDDSGFIPSYQLPSYVDDTLEFEGIENFPETGVSGLIYVDTLKNLTYRWSGSVYVEISPSLAIGTTQHTAAAGNHTHTFDDELDAESENAVQNKVVKVEIDNLKSEIDEQKDNITATATGNAITIESAKAPFAGMKLFGKTTQTVAADRTETSEETYGLWLEDGFISQSMATYVTVGWGQTLTQTIYLKIFKCVTVDTTCTPTVTGASSFSFNLTTQTISGVAITVNDGKITIKGTATEDINLVVGTITITDSGTVSVNHGFPAYDDIYSLSSLGDSGSFEVGVYGKNILLANCLTASGNYNSLVQVTNKITIPKGTPVTVSVDVVAEGTTKVYWNTTADFLPTYKEVTVTTTKTRITYNFVASKDIETPDTTPIFAILSKAGLNDGISVTASNAQLEFNSVATEYEPCTKQTLTMPYTLRSAGVQDEIDFAKGVKIEKTYKKVFYGNEGFSIDTNNTVGDGYFYHTDTNIKGSLTLSHSLSNRLTEKTGEDLYSNAEQGFAVRPGTSMQLRLRIDGCTTVAELQAKLKEWYDEGNPLTIITERATPIETTLSESELNAYRHLMTNKGNTTILSEADMEISYYVNKPNAQAIGSLHEQINNGYFKLQQAINVDEVIEQGGESSE